jgi:antitoxin component YwqK of YwqJK toxin-antitoxin module
VVSNWLPTMFLLLLNLSLAASVTEDRRSYADQTVQERWTWQDDKRQDALLRKEWFHPDGERSRLEEYQGGVLHGQVSSWDRGGVLQTEDHYRTGLLHGTSRRFDGPKDERWVSVHRDYSEGLPDGEQLLRRDAETVVLRHNYQQGQLHGSQQAWHSSGEMHYEMNLDNGLLHGEQRFWETGELEPSTYMLFEQGQAEGQQRYFYESNWRDEVWTAGLWEEVRSWHEEGSIPEALRVYELKVLPLDRHGNGEGEIDPTHPLDLRTQKGLVSKHRRWPNGQPQEQWDQVGDQPFHRWAENGQLVLEGFGDPNDRRGVWTEWRADGTLFKEEEWTDKRTGEVRTFDGQGRLREVETWEWERQRWQVILYEGDHKVAEGELFRTGSYRWGPWTYYRGDGSTRRTEVYGSGPYSGNRSFVVESQSFRVDGSVHCSGDERDLLCLEPQADGGHLELKVKALHRPRHGIETYQTETFSFQPRDLERSPLSEQALVVSVLDGEGLVTERRSLDSTGKELWVEQRRRDGSLARITGTGDTSSWEDIYDSQGLLASISETHPNGEICLVQMASGDEIRVMHQRPDGTTVVMGQGRDANKRVATCTFWTRHPELEGPR